jgi:hypothetical protein
MVQVVRIVLPLAAPTAYLAWMAFAREVSAAFRDRPAVAALAVPMAPATEEMLAAAEWMATQIMRQARDADREGLHVVAPWLEAPAETFARVLDHMEPRAAWLDRHLARPEVSTALGVEPLAPELVELRDRSFRAVREAIERSLSAQAKPA